jgi:hypothetical protein
MYNKINFVNATNAYNIFFEKKIFELKFSKFKKNIIGNNKNKPHNFIINANEAKIIEAK